MGCILNESGTDVAGCCRKVESEKNVAGARGLPLECVRGLHEELLVPVLLYGCASMIWRETERSGFRAVQMDSLRGLLGVRC